MSEARFPPLQGDGKRAGHRRHFHLLLPDPARILEIDPGAVLIVSSGYSSDPVVANFRQYGFSGMVPKPFDAKGLTRELKRLVP